MAYIGSSWEEAVKKLKKSEPSKAKLKEEIDKNKIKRQKWLEDLEIKYNGPLVRELNKLSDFNVRFPS